MLALHNEEIMRKLLLLLKRLFKKPQQALPKPPPVTTPAEPIKPLPPVEAPKPLLDLGLSKLLKSLKALRGVTHGQTSLVTLMVQGLLVEL
jgi:hypothetical protein